MFRKIAKYLVVSIIVGYAVFTFIGIPSLEKSGECKDVIVSMLDNELNIINADDIHDIIEREGLDPTGKDLEEFNCQDIEDALKAISLIDDCQVYKSVKGHLIVNARSKRPVLKIYDENNKQYHIDSKGDIIHGIEKALYLPVASGYINDSIASNELREIAGIIDSDKFWKSQIEQIYIDKNGKITMIPRVGSQVIEFGAAKDIESKFDKLYTFYKEGMNNIGWNKYSKINIEFSDKVICTKKDKR